MLEQQEGSKPNPERFKELFKQAIGIAASKPGQSKTSVKMQLADATGRTLDTIEWWLRRESNIPSIPELEKIATKLFELDGLRNQDEVRSFLECAGYQNTNLFLPGLPKSRKTLAAESNPKLVKGGDGQTGVVKTGDSNIKKVGGESGPASSPNSTSSASSDFGSKERGTSNRQFPSPSKKRIVIVGVLTVLGILSIAIVLWWWLVIRSSDGDLVFLNNKREAIVLGQGQCLKPKPQELHLFFVAQESNPSEILSELSLRFTLNPLDKTGQPHYFLYLETRVIHESLNYTVIQDSPKKYTIAVKKSSGKELSSTICFEVDVTN